MQHSSNFNDKDIEQCKALGFVIANGKFDLQGSAIVKVASLIQWYNSLGLKIQHAIKEQSLEKFKPDLKKSVNKIEHLNKDK